MKVILTLVLLLLATLTPSIEGASISVSTSPSYTTSVSGSISITNSYSTSVSGSISITNSYSTSISGSISVTLSLTHIPPNSVYNLVDKCPSTPQTLCLFWNGPFPAYMVSLTNTSGGVFSYNTSYTQFDATPISTMQFYQPGQSYMVEVRGLSSLVGGTATGSGAMITASKPTVNGYTPPSNTGPYLNNLLCTAVTATPTITCTFYRGTTRFKKYKVLIDSYANNGAHQSYRFRKRWPGAQSPLTISFTTTVLIQSFSYVRVRAFYRRNNGTRHERIRATVLT